MREVHQRNVAFYVVGRFKIQEEDGVVLLHYYPAKVHCYYKGKAFNLTCNLDAELLWGIILHVNNSYRPLFCICANRSNYETRSCRVTFFSSFFFFTQFLSLSFGFMLVLCNLVPQKVPLWSIKVEDLYLFQRLISKWGTIIMKKR